MVGLGRLELPTSRLSSARSNQLSYRPTTHLRIAFGALAQLGERLICIQEVVGSIPSGSTKLLSGKHVSLDASAVMARVVRRFLSL